MNVLLLMANRKCHLCPINTNVLNTGMVWHCLVKGTSSSAVINKSCHIYRLSSAESAIHLSLISRLTISVQKNEGDCHQERMPVELVLWITLPRKTTQKVSCPCSHQHDGHKSWHLKQDQTSSFETTINPDNCRTTFFWTIRRVMSGSSKLFCLVSCSPITLCHPCKIIH